MVQDVDEGELDQGSDQILIDIPIATLCGV